MRLTRLDLLCYGAFENRSASLRPDARLHVVYGANEAGKSTTLSAVRDLFFGFPARTTQDFRFKQTDLRVGGELLSRNGASLSFVRRKGTKNTLLDVAGAPLPDDALAPFLGQMSRDIFSAAFGLDAECLRKGADELLQTRGEVGSSLMAAASGLRGLATLRKQLDDSADGIFTANKSQTRRFYQARDRFDLAKKAIGDSELRAGAWKKLADAIATNGARVDDLRNALRKVRAERTRIGRQKSLAPLLRRIDAQQTQIDLDADLPRVPAGFIAEFDAALAASAKAAELIRRQTAALDDSTQALAAIAVDGGVLERAAEIDALVQRVSQFLKNNVDLPRVVSEHDGAQADLDRHARLLGLADAQAVVDAQPTQPALARVRDLAQQGQALTQEKAGFAYSLRSEFDLLEQLDALRAQQPALADPAPLQEKLAALGNVEAFVAARTQAAQALRRDEEALRQEAAALAIPVDNLAGLAGFAFPSPETIADFARRLDENATAERDALVRLRDAEQDAQAAQLRIASLSEGGEVPTQERIAAARAARDVEWAHLRASLFDAPEALSGAALPASVARFEVAGAQADLLADAAARDASRVADFAAQSAALDRHVGRAADAEASRLDLQTARAALEQAWTSLWSPAGILPLAPAAMQAWRTAARALLERQARLSGLRAEIVDADAELARLATPLALIAAEAGLPAMDIDAARQSARIAVRLRETAGAWEEARGLARRREDLEFRIAKLQRDLASHTRALDEWEGRWRASLPAIGLSADTGIVEALAAIDVWKLAPQFIEKRDDLARRVAGLRRDIVAFEADAHALVAVLAPDLVGLPPATGVAQLRERLDAARRECARRDEVAKRKHACEADVRSAARVADGARATLAKLATQLPAGADPADLLQRLKRRAQLCDALDDWRRQLAEQANGVAEDAIRAELADFDPDRAEADFLALSMDEERLTQESQEAYAELKRAEQQVAEQQAGFGSETAWQQRMNAEAELQEAAREWLVLRLASAMLNDALERHRATRQDPLMQRASALFAELTGGAFSGIAQSFDDSDAAVLQGARASGECVGMEGLSEGTRDQLYLALRLAYVEDFATRAEPSPFIADDLFTSFDDARTLHGLRTLAATGVHLQCILFTHHRHVVDLARAELGAQVDVVEL
ncbi:MAG: hypothetical protein JWN07_1616 [Hyphomicrobiales bacterium]|nr:hypothetical protein [Hyphomicrobiales bacterium]